MVTQHDEKKGRFVFMLTPDMHRALKVQAALNDTSMSALIANILQRHLGAKGGDSE